MFLLGFFFLFFLLSYSCNVLGAYNELNKVRLAEESNMLWQQKHGLFLVTLSGEESSGRSSSGSCSTEPWCLGGSCCRLLLPRRAGLKRSGARKVGSTGPEQCGVKPDPATPSSAQRAAQNWGDVWGLWGRGNASVIVLSVAGAVEELGFTRVCLPCTTGCQEPGFGQEQHLPGSSLWGP